MEFSGDLGCNDAPKRPQEMDAAAYLIREKGYAPERLGFGPGVDMQVDSLFYPGPAGLQGAIGLVGGWESAESVGAFEPGYGSFYEGGWEPARPLDVETARLFEIRDRDEYTEQMSPVDGMEPMVGAEHTGLAEPRGHAGLAMENALDGELHFAPAPTPEEELHVDVGHEPGTAPQVEIQPVPTPKPEPVEVGEPEPELKTAQKEDLAVEPLLQPTSPAGAEEIQRERPELTEKEEVAKAETRPVPPVIVWKDFPKSRR